MKKVLLVLIMASIWLAGCSSQTETDSLKISWIEIEPEIGESVIGLDDSTEVYLKVEEMKNGDMLVFLNGKPLCQYNTSKFAVTVFNSNFSPGSEISGDCDLNDELGLIRVYVPIGRNIVGYKQADSGIQFEDGVLSFPKELRIQNGVLFAFPPPDENSKKIILEGDGTSVFELQRFEYTAVDIGYVLTDSHGEFLCSIVYSGSGGRSLNQGDNSSCLLGFSHPLLGDREGFVLLGNFEKVRISDN